MFSSSLSSGAAARPATRPSGSRRSSGRFLTFAPRAAKKADGPSVAIVGVTGAVGQEFLRVRIWFSPFFSLLPSLSFLQLPVPLCARFQSLMGIGSLIHAFSVKDEEKRDRRVERTSHRRDRPRLAIIEHRRPPAFFSFSFFSGSTFPLSTPPFCSQPLLQTKPQTLPPPRRSSRNATSPTPR